jgi:hypothetical protein
MGSFICLLWGGNSNYSSRRNRAEVEAEEYSLKLEVKLQCTVGLPVLSWVGEAGGGGVGKLQGRWVASHPPPLTASAGTKQCQVCWKQLWKRPAGGEGAVLSRFHFQRHFLDVLSYLKTQIRKRNHKSFPNHIWSFIMLIFLLIKIVCLFVCLFVCFSVKWSVPCTRRFTKDTK